MTRSMKKHSAIFAGSSERLIQLRTDARTRTSMLSPLRRTGKHSNAHHWRTTMGRAAAMVYSYTQISQYLRCLAAIATAIWMGGVKKKHGQRWSSVAALKKLWVRTFVKRIAP